MIFGLRLEQLEPLQKIGLHDKALQIACLVTLLYFGYSHITNWLVDRFAHVTSLDWEPFGDDQDMWNGDNPPLGGRITNARIILNQQYARATKAQASLVYVQHMLLPMALLAGATLALATSLAFH